MLTSSSEIAGIKHDYCIWNDRFHADTATQWHVPWNRLNMADGDNNPEIVISANEIPITYSQRPLCNVYKQIPRGFRVSAAWISAGDGLPRARGSSLARRTGHSRNYQLICLPLIRYVLFKRCPDLDFHLFGCKTLLERWRVTALENDLFRVFRVRSKRQRRLELNFLRAFQRMERYLFRILFDFNISFCIYFIIVE